MNPNEPTREELLQKALFLLSIARYINLMKRLGCKRLSIYDVVTESI